MPGVLSTLHINHVVRVIKFYPGIRGKKIFHRTVSANRDEGGDFNSCESILFLDRERFFIYIIIHAVVVLLSKDVGYLLEKMHERSGDPESIGFGDDEVVDIRFLISKVLGQRTRYSNSSYKREMI